MATHEAFPEPSSFSEHQRPILDWWSLQRLLVGTETVQEFLDEFTKQVAAAIDHRCSITVPGPGHRPAYTAASSDELTLQLDELQYARGDGPCLEALRTGQRVIVTDMANETRYGEYGRHAAQAGAGSSMSYPLTATAAAPIGVLNLYADGPVHPSEDLLARAETLSANVAGALALAQRLAEQHQSISDLNVALESRSTIDQAMGILMAQQRCNASSAFNLLVAASQNRNMKLRDVAANIVAGIGRDDPHNRSGRY
jgi:GAF domain-containing protein